MSLRLPDSITTFLMTISPLLCPTYYLTQHMTSQLIIKYLRSILRVALVSISYQISVNCMADWAWPNEPTPLAAVSYDGLSCWVNQLHFCYSYILVGSSVWNLSLDNNSLNQQISSWINAYAAIYSGNWTIPSHKRLINRGRSFELIFLSQLELQYFEIRNSI